MAVALVLGFVIRYRMGADSYPNYTECGFIWFDSELINFFLWPSVIFAGGWRCSTPHVLGQLPTIVLFSIMGSLMTAFVIARTSMLFHELGLHSFGGWRENFALGAVLSATEPMAAMATFTKVNLERDRPWLVALIFGESAVNTGIAILYLGVLNNMDEQPQAKILAQEMVVKFIGSMCFGCVCGLALSGPMVMAKFKGEASSEVFYIIFIPYLLYSVANEMFLSGTIACLFAGMVIRLICSAYFSESGFRTTGGFLESWAGFAGALIFVLCGASVAFIRMEHFGFCLMGLSLCVITRALVVTVCGATSNLVRICSNAREKEIISWKDMTVMSLSGTRGGITLLMAFWIDPRWCGQEAKTRIVTAAFFVVCVLLLAFGGLIGPCLRHLHMVSRQEMSKSFKFEHG